MKNLCLKLVGDDVLYKDGAKATKIDLYEPDFMIVKLEELDHMGFTAIYGDKVFYSLKRCIKRNPTQVEYDASIDMFYENYAAIMRANG